MKYSGVLASASQWRSRIGPRPQATATTATATTTTATSDTLDPTMTPAVTTARPRVAIAFGRSFSSGPSGSMCSRIRAVGVG
jgi:hypothetical protein